MFTEFYYSFDLHTSLCVQSEGSVMLDFLVISFNIIAIARLLKGYSFETDAIKLNVGEMKIKIGTPMKNGNVYLFGGDSTVKEGKQQEAYNLNFEKGQDQQFIWKKDGLKDKISVSKNNQRLNSLIMADKKDNNIDKRV